MKMIVCMNFVFLFMPLVRAQIVKNSHTLARVYFIFLKYVLKETWKSFNKKFWPPWKDRKSSYQVKQILAFVCNLIVLILG